jgi:glycerophosphoryl diester phosphodiesterase
MTPPAPHPLFARLLAASVGSPVVVAHRGSSVDHPENTVAAFRAAHALGIVMQEFDVRELRDGTFVCVHDETFDRTTDAAVVLGPGALVAEATRREVERLDTGAWFSPRFAGERIPTLDQAVAAIGADRIPMIERKAGDADRFVAALERRAALDACLVQAFDWTWLAEVRRRSPSTPLALLGPTPACARPDAHAVDAARRLGAGMLHWSVDAIDAECVRLARHAGLLLCTYTTDTTIGWFGGRALGVHAMCTNRPASMLAALRG